MSKAIYNLAFIFLFVAAVGFAGCKGSDSKKSGKAKKSAVMLKFEALEKKACACKDAKCTDAVTKDLMKLAGKTKMRDTRKEQDQLEAVLKRATECLKKATTKKAK